MEEDFKMLNESEIEDIFNQYSEDNVKEDKGSEEKNETEVTEPKDNNDEDNKRITEDDVANAFSLENVGEEEEKEENKKKGKTTVEKQGGVSQQKNNFYSSIAKALLEDGVFSNLSEEDIKDINDSEGLKSLFKKQNESLLTEKQKRIDAVLNYGVEPNIISQYERTIDFLNSVSDDDLTDEGEKGNNLRQQLIYQDLINKGYSQERAVKRVNQIFENGEDVEEAKESFKSINQYYTSTYNKLIEEAKERKNAESRREKDDAEKLRKNILEGKDDLFDSLNVDKKTRQKIFNNISNFVYTDEDGNKLSAIQKYSKENVFDYLKYVSLFYTITDGFKNFDGLFDKKVKKEVNKGLRNLEKVINGSSFDTNGSFMNDRLPDPYANFTVDL